MVSLRATARALLVLALFGIAAGTAAAFTPPPEPKPRPPKPEPRPKPPRRRKQIVFPVLGTASSRTTSALRGAQGSHEGIDILAPAPRARARGRGRPGPLLRGLDPGRLHALPRRPQRHDVPLHPPEQRPHRRGTTTAVAARSASPSHAGSRAAPASRPGSRSASSATRATRTGSIRTCTSRASVGADER